MVKLRSVGSQRIHLDIDKIRNVHGKIGLQVIKLNVVVHMLRAVGLLRFAVFTNGFPLMKASPKTGFDHHSRRNTMVGMTIARCVAEYDSGFMEAQQFNNSLLAGKVIHQSTVGQVEIDPK